MALCSLLFCKFPENTAYMSHIPHKSPVVIPGQTLNNSRLEGLNYATTKNIQL